MGITVRYHKHLFLRLSVLFVCLLVGLTLFAQTSFAQGPDDANREASSRLILDPVTSVTNTPSNNTRGSALTPSEAAAYTQYGETRSAAVTETGGGDYSAPSGDSKIATLIYEGGVGIGGFIAGLGGSIFDLAINKVVLKMGCWFVKEPLQSCEGVGGSGSVGGVVNALWIVIRDLFNILFIFSLIYIGLKTIWSNDSSTKRALGMLIAAALLINFSLYVTKVIVDMSNFAAVSIHEQAVKGITGEKYRLQVKGEGNAEAIADITAGGEKSLSAAYMQTLKLSSWFSADLENKSVGKIITFVLMFLLVVIILGLTLAWGGIMLITRFVALIIFMIFSPAMFLGWVLPQFQKYSSQWWKMFLSYAFFAPAYIFMLYLGLYTLVQMEDSFTKNGSYAKAFSEGGGEFSIFLFFVIGIVFLIAATKVGQMMGVAGAGTAMATMKGAKNKIQGGARWGTGYAASAGTGFLARKAGGYMDRKSAASKTPRSRWAQGRRNIVMKGETAKFGGTRSSKERVDADKAEATRHSVSSRAHSAQQSILKASTPIDRETAVAKADGSVLIEMTKTDAGRASLISNAGSISDEKMKEIMKSDDVTPEIKKTLSEEKKGQVSINLIEEHKSGGTIGDVLHKASVSELKTIGFDTAQENASSLTSKQIEDWKDLTPTQKRSLKKKRADDLISAFKTPTGPKAIFTQFKNDTERSKLPKDILLDTEAVTYLNKNILTKIVDNDGIEDDDRRIIRSNIETQFPSGTAEGKRWREWFDKNNAGQRYPS